MATFSGALFLLVLALVRGNDEGWGSTLIVVAARRRRRRCWPRSSRSSARVARADAAARASSGGRAFTGVQLAAFAVSGSMFALFLYLTLYLQNYLGLPPFEAGPALPADHARELLRRAGRRGAALARARRGC